MTSRTDSDAAFTLDRPPELLKNWIAVVGEKLTDCGYPVIPVWPGAKCPASYQSSKGWLPYRDWQRHCARPSKPYELAIWSGWPGCSVGIACGMVGALDIDLLEPEIADKVEKLARRELGDTDAWRVGLAPKKLLVYRQDQPFGKIPRHPLEWLGQGSQFVAYGVHPATKQPYRWPDEELFDVLASRLPIVTEAKVRAFMDQAVGLIPAELRQSKFSVDRSDEFCLRAGGDQRGTPEATAEAVEHIPNDDLCYDDWIMVGLAIKGSVGEAAGWPLFQEWSASSSKDDPKETARAWRSFKKPTIGFPKLYYLAVEHGGWAPDADLIFSQAAAEAMQTVDISGLVAKAGKAAATGNGTTTGQRPDNDHRCPPHDPETGEVLEESAPLLENEHPLPAPVEVDIVRDAGGVLGELVDWMVATARYPQPLLCLGAAIVTCGALMGHRYRLLDGPDTRTNVMVLALAGSGSGKDHPRSCVRDALERAGLGAFLLSRSIGSAQGIISRLGNQFSGLMMVDEIGHVLAGVMGERAPPHLRAIASLLTELSTSASGMFLDDARAGDRDPTTVRYDVPDPCFGLFATTVPEPLWAALNSGHAIDGFLARFLLLETPLNYPDAVFDAEPKDKRIDAIAASLRKLVVGPGVDPTDLAVASALGGMQPSWEGDPPRRTRRVTMPHVPAVPMTSAAKAMDRESTIAEVAAKRANEGKTLATSIVARTCEHVRRLALIRAVSRSPKLPAVDADDMRWARAVVALSQARMIPAVEAHVADTPWAASVKKVLSVIRKHGDWMNGSQLANKTQFLKSRDRHDIIIQLVEAGEIEIQKEQTTTKPRLLVRIAR